MTDGASCFTGHDLLQMLNDCGIKRMNSGQLTSKRNGAVEWASGSIIERSKAVMVSGAEWDVKHLNVLFNIRTMQHSILGKSSA